MTFAAAVPGPDGQPLDQIRLAGVTATGHHGVLAHERAEGQVFSADVVLHLDTRAAASSDDLANTVSYADVAQDVHNVLAGSPADLVETVAERIAAVVLASPAVQAVDVRVHKPQAPIPVPFDDVAIVVRRDRSRPPVVDVAPVAEPAEAAAPVAPVVPAEVHAPIPPAPVAAAVPVGPVEPEVAPAPAGDPLDATPAEPVEAVLALGANLGDAQVTLRQAVTDVDRLPGVQVMEVSPLARTAAVGGPEQPDYLNAVLVVRTTLSPRDLLRSTQQVEAQHGRVREERWGPRTLDVDIVQYGSLVASGPDLELPHPRAQERAFVLVPWAEVAPEALLGGPGGGPVGQLAVTAPDRAGIRWLALDWLTGPTQSTGQVSAGSDPAPSSPVPQSQPEPQEHSSEAYPAQGYPAAPHGAEPSAAEPEGQSHDQPYAQPFTPPVAEPKQQADPRRDAHDSGAYGSDAHGADAFGDPAQPLTPRPFAAVPPVAHDAGPHAPVPSAPASSNPVSSAPAPQAPASPAPAPSAPAAPSPAAPSNPPAGSSFAPPVASAPEPYAPEPYSPEQYSPEPYAPEPYAPEPSAPVAYVPEQLAPDRTTPQPAAPGPVRHEPVPPAPAPAPQAAVNPPALPDPFAPLPDAHPGQALPQERYGEDDR
ncbi:MULTISPECIES: 2-amino-4-hydroxy-6-hydroxymethyldihydropteridine diphosphokinase [unclassified Isoptericola]|uniref:2-amino-4-hydroxy-6- hydroxymethyldihydropteridine diphosphokinase n=1 Tax=unclassified Isoptericola TaxID=2623355 RepID=UPI00365BCB6A